MSDFWGGQYILDEQGNPVPERDLLAWGEWLEKADTRLAFTEFAWGAVSTVFLGLDHNFESRAEDDPLGHRPVLWETMAFRNATDEEKAEWTRAGMRGSRRWGEVLGMEQYASREDALKGHQKLVEKAKQGAAREEDRISLEVTKAGSRE